MKAPPTPSRMPATGSTATGSMSDFPSFCRKPKKSLQIFFNGLGLTTVSATGASVVDVDIRTFLPRAVGPSSSGHVVVVGRHQGANRGGGILNEGTGGQLPAVREG